MMFRNLINTISNINLKKRISDIDKFKNSPFRSQEEILFHLIKKMSSTEYGKKFSFKNVDNYDTFSQTVPIVKYEDIVCFIDRMRNGEKDILWPGRVKWFAKSSGTTNDKSKYIPITKENIENCHFKAGKDMLSIYLNNNPKSEIFKGEFLKLGGSYSFNKSSSNGDLSAIIMKKSPQWANFLSVPKNKISTLENWEQKVNMIIDDILNRDIRCFLGVPSWMLSLFNKLLEKTGRDNLLEIFPNLELYFHGGINFTPYQEIYKRLIPNTKFKYYEVYNASEGFIGIQDSNNSKDLLLLLNHGIFYEFIAMDDFNSGNMKTVPIWDVKKDINYALVITTNSGLCRYLIGDTVRFTSTAPYRVKITGRTKYFINAFGEELIFENVENSLKIACENTNSIVHEFTIAPIYMTENKKGKHQWLIEFKKAPENIEDFISILERELRSLNSDYDAKRKTNTLEKLDVVIAPKNTFYNWMNKRKKLGGQNKVPKLSNNRTYIDDILNLIS